MASNNVNLPLHFTRMELNILIRAIDREYEFVNSPRAPQMSHAEKVAWLSEIAGIKDKLEDANG